MAWGGALHDHAAAQSRRYSARLHQPLPMARSTAKRRHTANTESMGDPSFPTPWDPRENSQGNPLGWVAGSKAKAKFQLLGATAT